MRDYSIYDVFTAERYSGNQLAVVHDAEGLSDDDMLAIAIEFNLSETIFLFQPEHPSHSARVRILTPGGELPFAGHPTVGAAIALAQRQHGSETSIDMVTVLGETIGPVRCAVKLKKDAAGFAEFDLPRLSEKVPETIAASKLADALGISTEEIGFENHVPMVFTAGVPFIMVPVRNLSVAGDIEFDPRIWRSFAPLVQGLPVSAYVYTRSGVRHDCDFHARMFTADLGMMEDPATGSAAAAFSGAIQHFDAPGEGAHAFVIEQGVEMGRPSYIRLSMEISPAGDITTARIGGQAVPVAEGKLF